MTDQAGGELVPGGLALVVGSISFPSLIGRNVRLIEFLRAGSFSSWRSEDCRRSAENVSDRDCWLCDVDGLSMRAVRLFVPEHLMPINPSADRLSIDKRQECEA